MGKYRVLPTMGFVVSLTATLLLGADSRENPPAKTANKPLGKVALLKKIDVSGFGTWCGLRLGDLNGNGQLDVLLARHRNQNVTCLTATDIDGQRLWQVGKPEAGDHKASSDLPVQIYDIDLDGTNEVVCVMDGNLKILNGKDGAVEREAPLPSSDARDCIAFANFSGNDRPQDILIKNRYRKVWALDRNLRTIWSYAGNTGHYPWPYDFDGDGRDELMCGFTLLDHNGKKKWEAKLPGHADGVAIGDVDVDRSNGKEIALACCGGNTFALLNEKGGFLWRHPCGHSQHIIIGDFRPDVPGKEVCCLDRGNNRSATGVDAMVLYSAGGRLLWHEKRTDPGKNRWISIITKVENWDGAPGDLILGYRRGGSTPPTLYDGHGKPVAVFPFPNPENQHFAQHADICGDDREEIVVSNEKDIYIYKNGAPWAGAKHPQKRPQTKPLYNYTLYIGMP